MVFAPLKALKPSPATQLSIDGLVRLFRGDCDPDGYERSSGYASEGLALAVCERYGPSSKRDLIDRFYPEFKGKSLELEHWVQEYICGGYDLWEKLGKPRVGKTGRSER